MKKIFVVEIKIIAIDGKPLLGYCGHGQTDRTREVPEAFMAETLVAYQVLEIQHKPSRFERFEDGYAIFRSHVHGHDIIDCKYKIIREEQDVYVLSSESVFIPHAIPCVK